MFDDSCKIFDTCNSVPTPTEPMKAIIIELNDILNECGIKARCIEEQLFGSRPAEPTCKEADITCMYDALVALRRTAKETAEILYSVNHRSEG